MASNSQLPDLQKHLLGRSLVLKIIESAFLATIILLSIVGNSLVCLVVYRRVALRTITNMIIVGLAVTGITMAVVVMPQSLVAQVFGYWALGDLMCHIQGFAVYLLVFQALQLVTLTAVNRNVHVTRPWLHKRIFTRRNTFLSIIFTVLFSGVIVGSVTLSLSAKFAFHPGKAFCSVVVPSLTLSHQFTVVLAVFFVALPAAVISVCYAMIWGKIRRHSREYEAHRGKLDSRSVLSRQEGKVTRIVLAIISGFSLCWIPCVVIDAIDTNQESYLPRQVYILYTYLGYTSVMISPWIYGGMDKSVRKEMYCMICTCKAGTNT